MEIEKSKKALLNSNPNQVLDHLKNLQQQTKQSWVDLERYQDFQVEIKPDDSVTPGKFKPSKIQNGLYYAHSQTIMAMKKNIFMPGSQEDELEIPYQCQKCKTQLDVQFWHFCPYCSEKFPF